VLLSKCTAYLSRQPMIGGWGLIQYPPRCPPRWHPPLPIGKGGETSNMMDAPRRGGNHGRGEVGRRPWAPSCGGAVFLEVDSVVSQGRARADGKGQRSQQNCWPTVDLSANSYTSLAHYCIHPPASCPSWSGHFGRGAPQGRP